MAEKKYVVSSIKKVTTQYENYLTQVLRWMICKRCPREVG